MYTYSYFCDHRSGAGVFSDILKLEESYSLGTYPTVYVSLFQAEIYAILTCSDFRHIKKQDFKMRLSPVFVQNLFINSHAVLELTSDALYTATLLPNWQEGFQLQYFAALNPLGHFQDPLFS
jgi:hypothetical protein